MKAAQAALEYIFLIGVIAAAFILILVYVNRGFQGRLRLQASSVGEQYAPKGMTTSMTQTTEVTYKDTTDGKVSRSKRDSVMTNVGNENITRQLGNEGW